MGGELGAPSFISSVYFTAFKHVLFPIASSNYLLWLYGGFLFEFAYVYWVFKMITRVFKKDFPIWKKIWGICIVAFLFYIIWIGTLKTGYIPVGSYKECDTYIARQNVGVSVDRCIFGEIRDMLDFQEGDPLDYSYTKPSVNVDKFKSVVSLCDLIRAPKLRDRCIEDVVTRSLGQRITDLRMIKAPEKTYKGDTRIIEATQAIVDPSITYSSYIDACNNMKSRDKLYFSCMVAVDAGHTDLQYTSRIDWCENMQFPSRNTTSIKESWEYDEFEWMTKENVSTKDECREYRSNIQNATEGFLAESIGGLENVEDDSQY